MKTDMDRLGRTNDKENLETGTPIDNALNNKMKPSKKFKDTVAKAAKSLKKVKKLHKKGPIYSPF